MCPATGAAVQEAKELRAAPSGAKFSDGHMPRVLIDLTTSWQWKGKHAVGILRTEREIARRLIDNAKLHTLPVVFHQDAFRLLSGEYARSLLITEEAPGAVEVPARTERAKAESTPPLRTRRLRPFKNLLRKSVSRALRLLPDKASEELRLALIHARQAFREFVSRPSPEQPVLLLKKRNAEEVLDLSLVVHPASTDILFVCGLSWDVLNWPRISELRQNTGLRIVSVMYDLIPIKFPEFVGGPQPVLQNCFLHMVDNSDLIFCISSCTEKDFLEFVRANGRPAVPTDIIYLGANVPALPNLMSIPGESVRARLSTRRFALTVGTFEIRKNYALLVDLWEDLLADPAFELDLVIVGMPGWLVEDTVTRLQALPGFGTRIHWFKRLSDSGLSWLYENCHVFLFPSLYEGWGLPVAEALLHKSPTIASNMGATPEAAFGQALLLDPNDRAVWKKALVETAKAPRRVVAFDSSDLPTWDQTAETVAQALVRVAVDQEARI